MLVFIVASKSSVETSRMEARVCWRPALLTRMSSPPSPRTASSTSVRQKASSRRSPGIASPVRPSALISVDHLLRIRLLGRKIIDRDVRALARIGDGGGAAHAGIAAGDQRLAAGQPARTPVAARHGRAAGPSSRRGPANPVRCPRERRRRKFLGRILQRFRSDLPTQLAAAARRPARRTRRRWSRRPRRRCDAVKGNLDSLS